MTRWFILRTSSGQTLPLAASLRDAGFDVWTPARTLRRVMWRGRPCEKRVEVDTPILPTFVFAREGDLLALAEAAVQPVSPHPAFSIFRHDGRIPLVGDRDVVGLQEEERRAAAEMQAIRDAETHKEAERIRIAALRSDAARRRAQWALDKARITELRAQTPTFEPGAAVGVEDMPALAGVTGIVVGREGPIAEVRFGKQAWKIEAWRLSPIAVDDDAALTGTAA